MSLILTLISKHGIVHASDSNVTLGRGTSVVERQKIFQINHLNAGLSVAGAYSVQGIGMDQWMNNFIQQQGNARVSSVSDFASNLRGALELQLSSDEKNRGSFVHIAGYVEENSMSHPEFWFVRNVTGINNNTGAYNGFSSSFQVTEDFWTRDCPNNNLIETFQTGNYQIYVNGFASGRIGFVAIQRIRDRFFQMVWNNSDWRFRPPRSINESMMLLELNAKIILTLFQLSDYRAPYIGGAVQTFVIPQPPNMVTESPALLE